MTNISAIFVEKIKTRILYSITFFSEIRGVCKIMWKHAVEPDGPQMTTCRMRIACWIHKATNTNSKYGILYTVSTAKMVA
jgi:hypothetical protein